MSVKCFQGVRIHLRSSGIKNRVIFFGHKKSRPGRTGTCCLGLANRTGNRIVFFSSGVALASVGHMTVFSVMFRIRLSYPEISMFVNSQHVFLVIFFVFRRFRYCVSDCHVLSTPSRCPLRRESPLATALPGTISQVCTSVTISGAHRNNGVNQVSGADNI